LVVDGRLTGFIGLYKDISERVQLETELKEYSEHLEELVEKKTEQLKETQKKLLAAERLAAIGELAGMVGHDLRNPLTGIAGAAYYIKADSNSKLDKESKEMIAVIEEDIQRSNKIINDLLEYSSEIDLDYSETTPRSLLNATLPLIEIPKNIQLNNLTRNTPSLEVDVEKIERIFINIIKNAVEAMPKGGKLTIRSKKSSGNVEFSFQDTGEGMASCVLDKIWAPLFTTKAKGMGFGLPISKRLAEAHGGNISVRSAICKGSTFKVTIPIKPQARRDEQVCVSNRETVFSTMTKA
jgi:signal transduction histidine kinase